MSKHFDVINNKIGEFLQFAQMMNMRAVRDISVEMVDIMRAALADGYTLEHYKKEAEAAAGMPVPEGDQIFEFIKGWFAKAEKLEAGK